nr:sulfotransferase [Pseudomonas sp. A46]
MNSVLQSSLTIVFVADGGALEGKAAVLASSLRRAFGATVNIIAAQPEPVSSLGELGPESIRLYDRLSIQRLPVTNPFGKEYLIGNKISAVGLGPKDGYTLFLDSDIYCLRPLEFVSLMDFDAALKAVDQMLVPSSECFWKRLYAHAGLTLPDTGGVTTATGEFIPQYFNSGFIFVRNGPQLAECWSNIAKRIDVDVQISSKRPWLDQLSLPVALLSLGLRVRAIDERYNFPLHLKPLAAAAHRPFFCHYHEPDCLFRESELRYELAALIHWEPALSDVLSKDSAWSEALNWPTLSISRPAAGQGQGQGHGENLVITGVPRSGTSFLCRLLSEHPDTVVLNEPSGALDALRLEPLPWGLPRYYDELRRDILSSKPVPNKHIDGRLVDDTAVGDKPATDYFPRLSSRAFRLGTKNTLGYLSRLPLIRRVMPDALLVVTIRHPYDSLDSWSRTFQHLRHADVSSQPFGNPDDLSLTGWQRKALIEILDTKFLPLKRALWWRYLAQQVLEAAEFSQVLRYEELVECPRESTSRLLEGTLTLSRDWFSWQDGLSELDEQDLVANVVCDVAEQFQYIL